MAIVEKVKQYFFTSHAFEETFMGWARANAHIIDLTSQENKLEYTPLHNSFVEFFETTIEGVIVAGGGTVEEFYKELKESDKADPDGEDAMFVKIILAATEYEMFMVMMRDIAKEVATSK